jgi:hypothetical protein
LPQPRTLRIIKLFEIDPWVLPRMTLCTSSVTKSTITRTFLGQLQHPLWGHELKSKPIHRRLLVGNIELHHGGSVTKVKLNELPADAGQQTVCLVPQPLIVQLDGSVQNLLQHRPGILVGLQVPQLSEFLPTKISGVFDCSRPVHPGS